MKANHPPELRPSVTQVTCDFLRRRGRGVAAATMVLIAVVACDEGPASPTRTCEPQDPEVPQGDPEEIPVDSISGV